MCVCVYHICRALYTKITVLSHQAPNAWPNS